MKITKHFMLEFMLTGVIILISSGVFAVIDFQPSPDWTSGDSRCSTGGVVGDVDGRDCLIVDDLIDTAGTMSEAAHALVRLGARKVYCCATHALLSGPAVDRLSSCPAEEVAVTNTRLVPEELRFDRLKILSIAQLLAQAIRFTHSDQSVSSLFY